MSTFHEPCNLNVHYAQCEEKSLKQTLAALRLDGLLTAPDDHLYWRKLLEKILARPLLIRKLSAPPESY